MDHDERYLPCDLGFKVTSAFRTRFRLAAALTGLSMKDILAEAFEVWIEKKGLHL